MINYIENQTKSAFNEVCVEIKKMNNQEIYCANKFKKDDIINYNLCLDSFCSICCEGNTKCINNCEIKQNFNNIEEDLFKRCSFDETGNHFKLICDNLEFDGNKTRLDKCINDLCYDCCLNEFKIKHISFDFQYNNKCLSKCKFKDYIPLKNENINKKNLQNDDLIFFATKSEKFKKLNKANNNINFNTKLINVNRVNTQLKNETLPEKNFSLNKNISNDNITESRKIKESDSKYCICYYRNLSKNYNKQC